MSSRKQRPAAGMGKVILVYEKYERKEVLTWQEEADPMFLLLDACGSTYNKEAFISNTDHGPMKSACAEEPRLKANVFVLRLDRDVWSALGVELTGTWIGDSQHLASIARLATGRCPKHHSSDYHSMWLWTLCRPRESLR